MEGHEQKMFQNFSMDVTFRKQSLFISVFISNINESIVSKKLLELTCPTVKKLVSVFQLSRWLGCIDHIF